MTVDFDRAAADYAAYRGGFPEDPFERLRAIEVGVGAQQADRLAASKQR